LIHFLSIISELDRFLYPEKKTWQSHIAKMAFLGVFYRVFYHRDGPFTVTDQKWSISFDGTNFYACFPSKWGLFFGHYVSNGCCPGLSVIELSLLLRSSHIFILSTQFQKHFDCNHRTINTRCDTRSKTRNFLSFFDECLTENSTEWGEEKLDVSQWENLQIRKVFSRASLRMGLNDAKELDFEKGMRWEGVSGMCSVSALNAHLI
jgi:hypothetical protein